MNTPPIQRISSPVDLLALVPCVLGFHPQDSLVLVVVAGEGGNLHARVDLPADDDEADLVVATLMNAVHQCGATRAALLAYTDEERSAAAAVERLTGELMIRDVEVVCAIRADGARWYSLDCDERCCPAEGRSYDLSAHPFTAQAVLDGQVTFPDRQALADSLVGADAAEIEAVGEAADDAMRRFHAAARNPLGLEEPDGPRRHLIAEGEWVRGRVRQYLTTGAPLDSAEVGRIAVAMVNIEVRDVAWAQMTRANAPTHVELWRDLVRRTPVELVAAPAALLGFSAWLAGDGALAWCAVERCQQAEPDYSLAQLISQALTAAVPPSTWQPIAVEDLSLFAG